MDLSRPFATVTPTLDGAVLAALAGADEAFSISQIGRIVTTASSEGIRKVLNRLTLQGVVLHNQVGRTNTYRLNPEHLAAEPILALAQLANTFLRRLEEHLRTWADPPTYAAVFGSSATGRMTLHSDIDLFLVRGPSQHPETDTDAWEHHLSLLARTVTSWTGNDARIVEYTEEDLRRAARAGEPLLSDVATQGLTVAGSRTWLSKQLRPHRPVHTGSQSSRRPR